MTIEEIKKIIDEADVMLIKGSNVLDVVELTEDKKKRIKDLLVDYQKIQPYGSEKHNFYKFNEETGEMTLLAEVDHIDEKKKTKIIKKKLDEMSKEEIIQVRDRICDGRNTCNGCSFAYSDKDNICKNMCDINFSWWKERYENLKNREFDVEVEK